MTTIQTAFGTKAEILNLLRNRLKNAIIQDQIVVTTAEWKARRADIQVNIQKKFAGQLLIVRSSACDEDSFLLSKAGVYSSCLNVDPIRDLGAAIDEVVDSYGQECSNDQILIQPMLTNIQISGVAFTRTLGFRAPWLVINYETEGITNAITSGATCNHQTLKLRRDAWPLHLPEPRLEKLVDTLIEIEVILKFDALDIEFALDLNNIVHIFQVRPITSKKEHDLVSDNCYIEAIDEARQLWHQLAEPPLHFPRNVAPLYGIMPDWNPAEIIGTSPGCLATSLYRYLITDEIWAIQRAEYGYRDVRPSPLIVSFAGRPYVDVRLSFASFIPASISDAVAARLLSFFMNWLRDRPELHDKIEFEVVPTCISPGFNMWETRLREEGRFSYSEIEDLRNGLHQITIAAFTRSQHDLEMVECLSDRYNKTLIRSDLSAIERAHILLNDCSKIGTLTFAHLARSNFIALTLLRRAEAIGSISSKAIKSFFLAFAQST